MLSKRGKMMCNGAASSIPQAKERVRRYARLIQKAGYSVHLTNIRMVTMSAVHTLNKDINMSKLAKDFCAQYEPELFSAATFKREGIHFTLFATGKMIMTGIKQLNQIENIVLPCIIELELL